MFYDFYKYYIDALSCIEEVSIWQNAVFAERVLFSVRLFHTRNVRQTELGSLTFAR